MKISKDDLEVINNNFDAIEICLEHIRDALQSISQYLVENQKKMKALEDKISELNIQINGAKDADNKEPATKH